MVNRPQSLEEKSNGLLIYPLEEKKILWLSDINKYLVVHAFAAEIIQAIHNGNDYNSIVSICNKKFDLQEEQIKALINEIQLTLSELKESSQKHNLEKTPDLSFFTSPKNIIEKYYHINDVVFFVEYETPRAAEINHPKISHFEVSPAQYFSHHFKVLHAKKTFSLQVNGEGIGTWSEENDHYLSGKFSMQLIQKLYDKDENEWLGVFHAAGVSDGRNSIMFLGDSGNGKSTLSALLMANGFDIFSDDFVPVERQNKGICKFPAAISVKKEALDILSPKFPELSNYIEYCNPASNKTFRFLPLINPNLLCLPCVALVFVKYEPNSGLQINRLEKDIAFQKLVPDSWISPLEDNVRDFLDWFGSLPCWQLTYSNNTAMLETVIKIFNEEQCHKVSID